MQVFGGPMGGASYVPVKYAGTCYGKDALAIEYNNQMLIVSIDDLEKAIATVRKHCNKKGYEIVNTVDTDNNDSWDKHYHVKIVNKKITKIGATMKKSNYSYWYYSSEDPVNLNQCKKFMTKCNGEEMHKRTVQRIMSAIREHYPKFYETIRKKVNNLA
jgi:uncharacterized membrane-anchored protein